MTKYNSPMHDISYDSMDELKLHFDDNQSRDSLSNKFDLNTFTTNSENVTPRDLVTSGLISHDGFSSPTPEELDGLYAKVNFSKKKMNQRRDDAILNNSDSVSIYGFNNPMVAMTLNERTEL
uniref:Uncharacterized protein LOC102804284 n=1 Tax=Saccoglossus kowalevskii TaxID=10224 RepID=A0ABM0MBC1_SACKO|nr:PREDICTED: uncharacterized protein LOC102804284 [Saccoglossus kowalevskii]